MCSMLEPFNTNVWMFKDLQMYTQQKILTILENQLRLNEKLKRIEQTSFKIKEASIDQLIAAEQEISTLLSAAKVTCLLLLGQFP